MSFLPIPGEVTFEAWMIPYNMGLTYILLMLIGDIVFGLAGSRGMIRLPTWAKLLGGLGLLMLTPVPSGIIFLGLVLATASGSVGAGAILAMFGAWTWALCIYHKVEPQIRQAG